ncbi:MAG: hypothetical protein IJQ45_04125 [Clostridia bacterium]|nr:hypothetical protein [Clostridia bacterium]
MKRLFIICICFMLLVAAVGCRAKISSEAEPGDTVAQEQPAITQESVPVDVPVSDAGNNQFEGDFIEVKPQCPPAYGITFRLPTDWVYEVIQSDDAPTSDLVVSIRPVFPGTEGVITLQHCDGFGVCGTGLVQKDIVFNGHEAWQGFYDGQSLWSFIALKDPKDCVIVNSADNWYEEYEEEINQILSTVEFVYYEDNASVAKPPEPIIDSASFDIDGDGIIEDCTITYGPTSGLFTVVITASVNGNIKYKNTFNLAWGELSFGEQEDGSPCIIRERSQDQEPKAEYLPLSVREGRIVIDGLDPTYEWYWGDDKWNYGLEVGVDVQTETESDAQSPGTFSSDFILEGIVRWAKTNLNLSDSKPYDMSALFGSDQAKALIRDHKAILFEDGSIVGYCSYAVPQSVKTTSSGDVVYGDGVDFVDSQIKAEADKIGKESYTNSGKDRVFFIISDKSRLNDLIGFYMNSSEGNCPAPEQSSYLGALSEDEKQKILEFAKGWYAENFPNYKDLVFEFAKDSSFGYTQYPQYKPGEIIILRVTSEKSFADSVRSCFIKITDSGYEVFNEGT